MPATSDDEFAEFKTDEATFDAMMAEAEPAEIVSASPHTVRVEQSDGSVFVLHVPAGGLFSVGAAISAAAELAVAHGPGRLGVHHLPAPAAALAG